MAAKRKDQSSKDIKASPKPFVKTITDNRRARFNYDILERIETGVVLKGTEIKSVRLGRANIRDAYAQVRDDEMWLQNMHISPWETGGYWNHEPVYPRRLLLHKKEILRLKRLVGQQGLTMIPLRLYIKGHHAKVELALAKGRRNYDKRRAIQQRETDREMARELRRRG